MRSSILVATSRRRKELLLKEPRPVNQAECLACHKPLDKTSFTFTLKQLTDVAKSK